MSELYDFFGDSPDLNPVEKVWILFKYTVQKEFLRLKQS